MFDYSEFLSGNIQIKTWVHNEPSHEMDIEIWIDGEYSQTVVVDLRVREALWDLTREVVA